MCWGKEPASQIRTCTPKILFRVHTGLHMLASLDPLFKMTAVLHRALCSSEQLHSRYTCTSTGYQGWAFTNLHFNEVCKGCILPLNT